MLPMMLRTILVLILLASHARPALAQWRISSQTKPEELGHGARFIRKDVAGPTEATLKLVFFDAARCALRVVDQPSKAEAGSLKEAMRRIGAVA